MSEVPVYPLSSDLEDVTAILEVVSRASFSDRLPSTHPQRRTPIFERLEAYCLSRRTPTFPGFPGMIGHVTGEWMCNFLNPDPSRNTRR